ncbi:MAG TPA: hypothetical protein VMI73_07880 [Trebonia sp.]|nr:hypothetical protein [Trebonia sp.]
MPSRTTAPAATAEQQPGPFPPADERADRVARERCRGGRDHGGERELREQFRAQLPALPAERPQCRQFAAPAAHDLPGAPGEHHFAGEQHESGQHHAVLAKAGPHRGADVAVVPDLVDKQGRPAVQARRQVDDPGGRRRAEDRLHVQASGADDFLCHGADLVLAGGRVARRAGHPDPDRPDRRGIVSAGEATGEGTDVGQRHDERRRRARITARVAVGRERPAAEQLPRPRVRSRQQLWQIR